MTAGEVAALAVAAAALITSIAQLLVAVNTHGAVATQVRQTNGLTANIAGLNRTLGQAEGREQHVAIDAREAGGDPPESTQRPHTAP